MKDKPKISKTLSPYAEVDKALVEAGFGERVVSNRRLQIWLWFIIMFSGGGVGTALLNYFLRGRV